MDYWGGGGGAKGMLVPPLKLLGGLPPPPLPTPIHKFSPKDWWKILKSFIKPNQSSSIPPLNKDGVTFEDHIDKANLLNNYFADQTPLDETHATPPPLP